MNIKTTCLQFGNRKRPNNVRYLTLVPIESQFLRPSLTIGAAGKRNMLLLILRWNSKCDCRSTGNHNHGITIRVICSAVVLVRLARCLQEHSLQFHPTNILTRLEVIQ